MNGTTQVQASANSETEAAATRKINQGVRFFTILFVLAALGMAADLFVTPHGAGVSPDGIRYLEGARHILLGQGYSTETGGDLKPITHWPPLFPMALAALGIFGLDPWTASRWFNSFLMGLNIWLTGYLVFKHTKASTWAALFGAFLMLISWDALQIHSCVLSDPLFLTLSLVGLAFLLAYFQSPRLVWLLASATALALATVARYIGLPLIAAAVGCLLFWSEKSWRDRLKESFIYGFVAVIPFGCFALRNRFVSDEPEGLGPGFRGMPHAFLPETFHTLIAWFLPRNLPGGLKWMVHGLAAVAVVFLLVLLFRSIRIRRQDNTAGWHFEVLVPVSFFVCYLSFYVMFVLFFFLDMRFEDMRYLMPLKPIAILAISAILGHHLVGAARTHLCRITAIAVCCIVSIGSLSRSLPWLQEEKDDGQAFASNDWRLSETMDLVKKIPADAEVYSNFYDVILLHTGRRAKTLPVVWDRYTEKPKSNYGEQLQTLQSELKRQKAFIVYFTHKERNYIVNADRLKQDLQLSVVSTTKDGVVYQTQEQAHQGQKAPTQVATRKDVSP